MAISKDKLQKLYVKKRNSSAEIARLFDCSEHKINYWLRKYGIRKRSISDAIYFKHNPNGDPFKIYQPRTIEEAKLFGLGLGLYWGEGTKRNRYSIRLGNTDPKLIRKFMEFISIFYGVPRNRLKFGLQIFSDISPRSALNFWKEKLKIDANQFYKVVVTPSRGLGTYKYKSEYGVITVQFHNKRLRDIICGTIENLK